MHVGSIQKRLKAFVSMNAETGTNMVTMREEKGTLVDAHLCARHRHPALGISEIVDASGKISG